MSLTFALTCLFILISVIWSIATAPAKPYQLIEKDTLKVITRVSPNIYYEDDLGPTGFEYTLLKLFAASQGKELEIVIGNDLESIYAALHNNEVDMISAGIQKTLLREQQFTFSLPFTESEAVVIYRAGNKRLRKTKDLVARDIAVLANSYFSSYLLDLKTQLPGIQWRELSGSDYFDLLEKIESGDIDYTIMDANEFQLYRGFFPSTKIAFKLGEKTQTVWAFKNSSKNTDLVLAANKFIDNLSTDNTLARLKERFFSQALHINQVAANEFAKNLERRLPLYIDEIKLISREFSIDWRLVAAISYQESRWNPTATSPTGVRGFMMLTNTTAKEVGVTNRLDLIQSLRGGIEYFINIKSRIPAGIVEPDRSWFALAAYNVGMGHLEDARVITQMRGGDPNSWYDVKQNLPLLTHKEWYSRVKYGYARGYEPVSYVQNIRHYFNILTWQGLPKDKLVNKRNDLNRQLGELDSLGENTDFSEFTLKEVGTSAKLSP